MTSKQDDDVDSTTNAIPLTPKSHILRRRLRPPMLNLPRNAISCGPIAALSSSSTLFRTRPSTRVEDETLSGSMWAVHARRGRRRANREDMFAIHPFMPISSNTAPLSLFAVFDGHGGTRAVKYTRDKLPQHIIKAVVQGSTIMDAFESAFLTTDRDFSASSPISVKHATPTPAASPPVPNLIPSPPLHTCKSTSACTPSLISRSYHDPKKKWEKNFKLSRTPSGSSFASVALNSPDITSSLAMGTNAAMNMIGHFHESANDRRLPKDHDSENDGGGPTHAFCRAHSMQVDRVPSSSASTLGLELRRYKTRVDEHLSSFAVRTGRSSGTTATVITITDSQIIIAHVGDSRAVLSRRGGTEVMRLCEDHRPGREDEATRIESAGGLIVQSKGTTRVNGVLAVSRSIGDVDFKDVVIARPDVNTFDLDGEEDFVLIASDGVWDVMDEKQVADVVMRRKVKLTRNSKDANWEEEGVNALVEWVWDKGSTDDICALVVDVRKYQEMARQQKAQSKESPSLSMDNGVDHDHDQSGDLDREVMTPLDLNGPMTQRRRQPKPF